MSSIDIPEANDFLNRQIDNEVDNISFSLKDSQSVVASSPVPELLTSTKFVSDVTQPQFEPSFCTDEPSIQSVDEQQSNNSAL